MVLAGSSSAATPTFAYFLNVDREVLEAYFVQCEQPDSSGKMKCKMLDILVSPNVSKSQAAKALVLSMIEHGEKTCVIGSGGGWETSFSQQGPHTWVANNGPEGSCGRVTIETLEEDPSKSATWYYTIRKATTAPANSSLCKSMPEGITKYEWSVAERPFTCETIKFGLPGT